LKNKRTLIFSLLIPLLLLAAFSGPILSGLGGFLAPRGAGSAEAVLVEGFQTAQDGMMAAALSLVREGRAGQLILILHHYPEKERLFAIQEHYPERLGEELERRGLGKTQYQVWLVPYNDHPITLQEAQTVVPLLARAGIRRAFLLCEGFHTRRSFLVYQNQGAPLGVRFIPYPYFPSYDQHSWWKHTEGIKEFVAQSLKLGYYWGKGYISFFSLIRESPAASGRQTWFFSESRLPFLYAKAYSIPLATPLSNLKL
jgi:hypothetical protein